MGIEEFLFVENDWLYKRFHERLEFVRSPRYLTLKTALNLFLQQGGELIVETGTQRLVDDPGGGSTTLFGAFCARYGKRLITVDNNPLALKVAMEVTREFRAHITYVRMDSVKFLKRFREPIDLLYLDSLDCPIEGDATEAQVHQLNELKAAYKNLHVGSLYLGDDNDFANGGKTRLAKRFLLKTREWRCILDHGQTLWQRIKSEPPSQERR